MDAGTTFDGLAALHHRFSRWLEDGLDLSKGPKAARGHAVTVTSVENGSRDTLHCRGTIAKAARPPAIKAPSRAQTNTMVIGVDCVVQTNPGSVAKNVHDTLPGPKPPFESIYRPADYRNLTVNMPLRKKGTYARISDKQGSFFTMSIHIPVVGGLTRHAWIQNIMYRADHARVDIPTCLGARPDDCPNFRWGTVLLEMAMAIARLFELDWVGLEDAAWIYKCGEDLALTVADYNMMQGKTPWYETKGFRVISPRAFLDLYHGYNHVCAAMDTRSARYQQSIRAMRAATFDDIVTRDHVVFWDAYKGKGHTVAEVLLDVSCRMDAGDKAACAAFSEADMPFAGIDNFMRTTRPDGWVRTHKKATEDGKKAANDSIIRVVLLTPGSNDDAVANDIYEKDRAVFAQRLQRKRQPNTTKKRRPRTKKVIRNARGRTQEEIWNQVRYNPAWDWVWCDACNRWRLVVVERNVVMGKGDAEYPTDEWVCFDCDEPEFVVRDETLAANESHYQGRRILPRHHNTKDGMERETDNVLECAYCDKQRYVDDKKWFRFVPQDDPYAFLCTNEGSQVVGHDSPLHEDFGA